MRPVLRDVLDRRVNSVLQQNAQRRLVDGNGACSSDMEPIGAGFEGYDINYYARGALYIEALQMFAPDLKLTTKDTENAAVQARFNAREIPLAKFRLPADQRYFRVAICLVRLQPELSTDLVIRDHTPPATFRIEAAIVNRAKSCIGNARRVNFDPAQLRFYLGEALYRWTLAARSVDTLVPAEG